MELVPARPRRIVPAAVLSPDTGWLFVSRFPPYTGNQLSLEFIRAPVANSGKLLKPVERSVAAGGDTAPAGNRFYRAFYNFVARCSFSPRKTLARLASPGFPLCRKGPGASGRRREPGDRIGDPGAEVQHGA